MTVLRPSFTWSSVLSASASTLVILLLISSLLLLTWRMPFSTSSTFVRFSFENSAILWFSLRVLQRLLCSSLQARRAAGYQNQLSPSYVPFHHRSFGTFLTLPLYFQNPYCSFWTGIFISKHTNSSFMRTLSLIYIAFIIIHICDFSKII